MRSKIAGAFAALITPIDDSGRIDFDAFDRLIDFTLERELDGVVIGGATAEYTHFSVDDRARIAAQASKRIAGRAKMIVCAGTSSIYSTLELTTRIEELQPAAVLLPMPYFFRYEQQDLHAFCEQACQSSDLPFLLYNLPGFTNPLEVKTAIHLMSTVPNLIGMKDSSGFRENLTPLAEGKKSGDYCLLVGSDNLLLSSARAGWDGVISGIACFAPELIGAIHRNYRNANIEEAERLQGLLDEIIEQVICLPVPWIVRIGLSVRGIANGPMHLPLSPSRAKQICDFKVWFRAWAERHDLALEGVWSFFS